MGEDYWNESSVKTKVSQQAIFDTDGNNTLDDRLLDSSRSTPPIDTIGGSSARYRSTTATTNPSGITKPTVNNSPTVVPTTTSSSSSSNSQPKPTIPTSQISRPIEQPIESARFGRTTAAVSSNDTHSNLQWLPNAEDYPDQTKKDRSTQYDKEMELCCRNLLENKNFKLEEMQDYDKKTSLLRMAISFNTPSVTVPVLIFLENTLSRSLFFELIKKYPLAVNNYLNMTKLRYDNDYYVSMLKQLGRNEDVAMIRLRQASQTNDMNIKMAIIDQAATELGSHPWWHLQVAEQRLLLKKQRESQNSQVNGTVLDTYKTVYETDFRKQKQNRNTDKSAFDRSKEFETAFHMSPEIIMCGKLSVILQCGFRSYYDDFMHQAMHQGIFGKKYIIAAEYLADMVYSWARKIDGGSEKANETIGRFLMMISDPAKRVYYAEKFQNFDVAMDTIVNNLRDRLQLENLRKRMPRDHASYNRATQLLENTKWRN